MKDGRFICLIILFGLLICSLQVYATVKPAKPVEVRPYKVIVYSGDRVQVQFFKDQKPFDFKLGDGYELVCENLGTPEWCAERNEFRYPALGMIFEFNEEGCTKTISVSNCRAKTVEGLTNGSDFEGVECVYKEEADRFYLIDIEWGTTVFGMQYEKLGLAMMSSSDDYSRIRTFSIFAPQSVQLKLNRLREKEKPISYFNDIFGFIWGRN